MLKIVVLLSFSVAILAVKTTLRETPETYIEWKIDKFFDLPTTYIFSLGSPQFSFANGKWYLEIYPNGSTRDESRGLYISMYLKKVDSEADFHVQFSLGIKRPDGSQFVSFEGETIFNKVRTRFGWDKAFLRSVLLSSKDTVAPDGTLAVFCKVRVANSIEVFPQMTTTELDSRQNVSICNQSNSLINESQPLCRTACNATQGTEILSDNLKNMYTSKRFTDVTIICKNKEFSGHKNILSYRWTAFDSMLENNLDKIEITDCEPDTFEDFLRFIYTGKLVDMSHKKATSLYLTADKLNLYGLKEECAQYIAEHNLNIDSFYDVLRFANLHSDSMLLTATTEFFITNAKRILSTEKWKTFHADDPLQVNKLFLSYVEKKKLDLNRRV